MSTAISEASKFGRKRSAPSRPRAAEPKRTPGGWNEKHTAQVIERIKYWIKLRSTNAKAVSLDAGLGNTFVSDFIAGRSAAPGYLPMCNIAKALGIKLAILSGEIDVDDPVTVGLQKIPLVATIESGTFRSMPKEHKYPGTYAPPNRAYPHIMPFAVKVNDRTMDACTDGPIVPGMEVCCLDMASAEMKVEDGKLYVLRSSRDGQLWEFLIRRAHVTDDRITYKAESTQKIADIVTRGTPLIDSGIAPKRRNKKAPIIIGRVYFIGREVP